jgi:hypothetical protein
LDGAASLLAGAPQDAECTKGDSSDLATNSERVEPLSIRQRRAAELFQARPAFVPGRGAQGADFAVLVERQSGADLAPEKDALGVADHWAKDQPEPGGLVVACGDDGFAVGAEGSGSNEAWMLKQRSERLAAGAVPEPGGVLACGQDALALGTEGGDNNGVEGGGNNPAMVLKRRADRLATSAVPELGGVLACGQDALAVRAEGDGKNRFLMLKQRSERLAAGAVPEPGGPLSQ